MDFRKNLKKLFSILICAAILFTVVPSTYVKAETVLSVGEYISTSGTAEGEVESNFGSYIGEWKASIPIGKVMAAIESQMSAAANSGYYPHGKDGPHKIAYIEYSVTFPEDVIITSAGITMSNTSSMFNTKGFSNSTSGQTVTFKFPLIDTNWAGIYKLYNDDGGANSDKTIDFAIPYSVSATSYDEAKALEEKVIVGKGNFETHASGSWYAFTKIVHYTDESTQPLVSGFLDSNIFVEPEPVVPSENTIQLEGSLLADILINGNTQHDSVIELNKMDTFKVTGALNVKAIKDQMLALEAQHTADDVPTNITIENLETGFESVITLPDELEFTSANPTVTLNNANGKFEVISSVVDGKNLTVKLGLVNKNVSTYADIQDAVKGTGDSLEVEVNGVKFSSSAQPETNYTITGLVSGNFKAKATHTLTGNIINFDLSWKGEQEIGKEDSTKPNSVEITGTVSYKKPTENTIQLSSTLNGDILINTDTQHDKVIEFKKMDTFKVSGALNVTPIKEQLAALEAQYSADDIATNIKVENLETLFTAVVELPDGLEYTSTTPTVSLLNVNGQFVIESSEVVGKVMTVKMKLANEVTTLKEIKEAVEGVDTELVVEIDSVKFSDNAVANTNYTIKGTLSGNFNAKATDMLSGNILLFNYEWNSEQEAGKEDFTTPNAKTITGTVKYLLTETDITQEGILKGDILINTDTQHDKVIEFKKMDTFKVSGVLNVVPIKNILALLEQQYPASSTPENISVEDVETTFVATVELPIDLDFTSTTPNVILSGDNGKFKIVESKLVGKKLEVTLGLASEARTYKDVKEAVEGASNELKVEVDSVKFVPTAKADTNYTINGTLSGSFKAKATHTLSGRVINFVYNWNAEQEENKEDFTTPNAKTITGTVKYLLTESPYNTEGTLFGDILINGDTQNTKVIEFKKEDKFKVGGALDVKPIKELLNTIETQYGNVSSENISVEDVETTFIAEIELPEGLEFTSATPTATLNGANGNFKILESTLVGKKLTVKLGLAKEAKTFKDVKDAVTGANDELLVEVDGVKFGASATVNTNYTIKGTLSGVFKAKAINDLSGSAMNFAFDWEAEQINGKEDYTTPGAKTITGTVKYKNVPVITPNKPVVTVPNTAVNTEVGLFIKTLTLSVAGLYFVLKNKKK